VHVEGTPDAATVKTRLRAAGVHRAEFAPVAPMDFDANCGFVYHYATRALEKLVCDSPLGDATFESPASCPAPAQRLNSPQRPRFPWNSIVCRSAPLSMRCAPCAAASAAILRQLGQRAGKSPMPPLKPQAAMPECRQNLIAQRHAERWRNPRAHLVAALPWTVSNCAVTASPVPSRCRSLC